MTPSISQRLLLQRVRNGIIRYLEAMADPRVHTFLPPDEMIEMWADWVDEPVTRYADPVFTADESFALQRVQGDWLRLSEETPKTITTHEELYAAKVWPSFVESCRDAYQTFMRRGRLSEDVEVV